jgi:hypothetical protein
MPGAYQLLPFDAYFGAVTTSVVTFAAGDATQSFVDAYGTTITDATALERFLLGQEGRSAPTYEDLAHPAILEAPLLTGARAARVSLEEGWEIPPGATLSQIAGWGEETLANINYRSVPRCERIEEIVIEGRVSYYCASWTSALTMDANEVVDGDGTVVTPSALFTSTSSEQVRRYWVDLNDYNKNLIEATPFGRTHKNILEVSNLRELIHGIVSQSVNQQIDFISTSTPPYTGSLDRLTFTLHSPLTLEFTDELGNHIGPSTTTPDMIDLNVPGGRYKRYGEVQLLSIPKTATGTLTLRGITPGSFTLDVREETSGQTTGSTSFAGIPSATSTIATMLIAPDFSPTASGTLAIDMDGDGGVDETLPAAPGDVVLPDLVPPEVMFRFGTSSASLLTIGLDTSSTTVYSTASSTFVVDASGNATEVHFALRKEASHRIRVKIDALRYNGRSAPADALLCYRWYIDKRGAYAMFATYIKTASSTLEAYYLPAEDQTVIMAKPREFDESDNPISIAGRPVRTILPGMVVPGVQTLGGSVNIIY